MKTSDIPQGLRTPQEVIDALVTLTRHGVLLWRDGSARPNIHFCPESPENGPAEFSIIHDINVHETGNGWSYEYLFEPEGYHKLITRAQSDNLDEAIEAQQRLRSTFGCLGRRFEQWLAERKDAANVAV